MLTGFSMTTVNWAAGSCSREISSEVSRVVAVIAGAGVQADAAWARAREQEHQLQAAQQRMAVMEAEASLLRSRLAERGAAAVNAPGARACGAPGGPPPRAHACAAPMEPEEPVQVRDSAGILCICCGAEVTLVCVSGG